MIDVLIAPPRQRSKLTTSKLSNKGGDKPMKSLLKTISWRIVGTIDTITISYFVTGEITSALSIGSIEVVSKMILYYFHERIWSRADRLSKKAKNILGEYDFITGIGKN